MASKKEGVMALRDMGRALQVQQIERGQELLQLIRRRMMEVTDGFFEIGEALGETQNNRLYAAMGYDTLTDLLLKEGLMGPVQASKLVAVATLVPREDAVRLGPELSYAVTRYAHAIGTAPKALLEGKATVDGHRVSELSAVQLREATRRVVGGKREPSAAQQEHSQQARATQARLRKRGVKTAVVAARRQGRKWVFSVTVEEADMARLFGPSH